MAMYFCYHSVKIYDLFITSFFLSASAPLSHHLSRPTSATLSLPSQDQISIRGERQNLRLSFTANNGKSQAGLWQWHFPLPLLPLLLPPTKLCSQLWDQALLRKERISAVDSNLVETVFGTTKYIVRNQLKPCNVICWDLHWTTLHFSGSESYLWNSALEFIT